jgi:uncharacterized protein (DUF2344 family)
MTFGPALSLGVASLCEVVDVKIATDIDESAVLGDLSAGAQAGLCFVRGAKLEKGDAPVTRVIDAACYVVGIPRAVIRERGGEAWLRARVEAALAATELVVMRRIDGVGKRVEVRGLLRSVGVDEEAAVWLERAGIAGDLVALLVDVDIRASGGVKVAEVIEAVSGDAEMPHRAVRVTLGRRRGNGTVASPLELVELRAEGVSPSAVAAASADVDPVAVAVPVADAGA